VNDAPPIALASPEPTGWRGILRHAENLLVALALAAMVLLPLAEIVLRKWFAVNLSGAAISVQHLTLIVGMLGGALAARDGRLLSLSTLSTVLVGRWKSAAQILSGAGAAVIAGALAMASVEFVRIEREAPAILAYGIPTWWVQLVLPIGFAAIAVRLLLHSAATWRGRSLALLLTAATLAFLAFAEVPPAALVTPGLVAVLIATALGAPVFALLGGVALVLFWGDGLPIAAIPVTHYSLVTNPILPSLPLFTLAGYFLAEGGASKRLVAVFEQIFGRLRGGPAIVTVVVCAFFTSFTGASGVTILALGGLLMPVLLAARYSERSALGLITGSGSLGLLFPPCLPLILYAIVANSNAETGGVTIEQMFLGGFLPGMFLLAITIAWGISLSPGVQSSRLAFDRRAAARAMWEAKWELLLPVVALGALFSGWATAVQAAALTALYALITQTLLHRDLRLTKDVPRVMAECGLLVGGVLLILGVALGFTNYLVDAEIPAKGVAWVTAAVHSKYLFLLALNLFLLVVGCLMDIFSATIVVVPLLVPLGVAFGIDPIHLGIVFLANMELGFLTPPVGMNLFLSSYRFGKPMMEVTRAVLPVLLLRLVGVLLITYVPILTTFLPGLFR
jgi:C4-dicarboxylate transporter, DctM subunit